MERLYHKTRVIKSLKKYFMPYISVLTKPSGEKLFLLMLAVMAMQFVTSIRNIYRWFLSGIGKESLNSYYHLLTYSKMPLGKFAEKTISLALSLVEETGFFAKLVEKFTEK